MTRSRTRTQPTPHQVRGRILSSHTITAGGFSASCDGFAREPETDGLWFLSMVGSQTALKAIWTALLKQPPEAAFLIGGADGMVYTRTAEFAFERDSFLLLARSELAAPALHRRFLDRGSSAANVGRQRLAAGRTAAGAAGRVGSLRWPSRVDGAGAVAIHMGRVRGSRTQADKAAPTQSSAGLTIAVQVCDGTVVRGE